MWTKNRINIVPKLNQYNITLFYSHLLENKNLTIDDTL